MTGTAEEMTLAINPLQVGTDQKLLLIGGQIVLKNVLKLKHVFPLTILILEMETAG